MATALAETHCSFLKNLDFGAKPSNPVKLKIGHKQWNSELSLWVTQKLGNWLNAQVIKTHFHENGLTESKLNQEKNKAGYVSNVSNKLKASITEKLLLH